MKKYKLILRYICSGTNRLISFGSATCVVLWPISIPKQGCSQCGKGVRMQTVRKGVQEIKYIVHTFTYTQRYQTVSMLILRKTLPPEKWYEKTHIHSYRWVRLFSFFSCFFLFFGGIFLVLLRCVWPNIAWILWCMNERRNTFFFIIVFFFDHLNSRSLNIEGFRQNINAHWAERNLYVLFHGKPGSEIRYRFLIPMPQSARASNLTATAQPLAYIHIFPSVFL